MLAAIVLGMMLSTCSSPPSILERILRSGELIVWWLESQGGLR